MEAALEDASPLVHDDAPNNRTLTYRADYGDYEATTRGDDVVVVTRRYINQRLIPTAMEPRSVVASATPSTGEITVWSLTQVPHFVRIFLVPQHRLARAPHPGDCTRCRRRVRLQARHLRRRDHRSGAVAAARPSDQVDRNPKRGQPATIHGRDLIQHGEITATRDGKVRGLKVDLVANMGAYLQPADAEHSASGRHVPSHLQVRRAHAYLHRRLHEHDPTDAYRGAGRPEATFVIERLMDDLAAELDMDPMELRRRNGSTRTSSRTRPSRGSPTTAATTKPRRARPRSSSTTPDCAASSRSDANARIPCSSASASRPTPRWPA